MLTHSLLCLGDSYTIGEMVAENESFPYQIVKKLKDSGFNFSSPEIIAKTGWTTDELQDAINKYSFKPKYDFVTLLIGVNNQYRGRTVADYKSEFESLLKQAIKFSGGIANHVVVISIPDWGVTPFAKDRDQQQIALEIDSYNLVAAQITEKYKVNLIDITKSTRKHGKELPWLAADQLHPSGKEYEIWATEIFALISNKI